MKKVFTLLCILFVALSCQETQQRYWKDSDEIKAAKASINAYESGDWETWRSNFADTAKIFVNSTKPISIDERLNGLKGMTEAMSSYGFKHDDSEFMEMVLDQNDETWVYYWATHESTMAANQKTLIIPVHLALHYVEGKIVAEHIYFDGTEMTAELEGMGAFSEAESNMIAAAENYIKAWSDNDFELMKSITSSDLVRMANGEVTSTDQEGIGEAMKFWHTTIPDFNIVSRQNVVKGNKVYSSWTSSGTNTGNFGENPPTGKESITQGFTVLTFNNEGQIVHEEAYYDLLSVMNQWGYSVTPPAQ